MSVDVGKAFLAVPAIASPSIQGSKETAMSEQTPTGRRAHCLAKPLALTLLILARASFGGPEDPSHSTVIGVSPLLVDAAAEVWGLIARADNPVWPGWNASDTPLLLYLPGQQDLLINHPHPPEGFLRYSGPLAFPGGQVWVKDGPTLIAVDGQNTSKDVAGVKTLVVADPLSNLRQRVGGLLEDPRPAAEKARSIRFEDLVSDPYDQLAFIVHEAFHVYQARTAPSRETNEMLLLAYPTLSVKNNTLFALEAAELGRAIEARDSGARREAALRWLALRDERRTEIPARASQYEDGVEFMEGLAKYTEYRLFEVLEGRTPAPGLLRAQGFRGYSDLSARRHQLLEQMRKNMRGEVNVNNDPYGTAPVRFRLYYSGMAVGLLLDRIAPDWKQQLWSSDRSMTEIARSALHPSDTERAAALAAVRSEPAYSDVFASKTKLAEAGHKEFAARLAAIETGTGTGITVDYSALASSKVALGFTPFGITVVDEARTIFAQIPINAKFGDGSQISEVFALPMLRDTSRRQMKIRLENPISQAEVARRIAPAVLGATTPRPVVLELPGVKLDLKNATIEWEANTLRIALAPTGESH
jgi:hypothetical protein